MCYWNRSRYLQLSKQLVKQRLPCYMSTLSEAPSSAAVVLQWWSGGAANELVWYMSEGGWFVDCIVLSGNEEDTTVFAGSVLLVPLWTTPSLPQTATVVVATTIRVWVNINMHMKLVRKMLFPQEKISIILNWANCFPFISMSGLHIQFPKRFNKERQWKKLNNLSEQCWCLLCLWLRARMRFLLLFSF